MQKIHLTPAQVAEAQAALLALNQLLPQIDALQSCGHDCQALTQQIKQTTHRLQLLLQHFGPGPDMSS